jgi:L-seryl-tRNA(Ser) seleniumtransferase
MKVNEESASSLRTLPSIDAVLQTAGVMALMPDAGASHLTELAREVVDTLRSELLISRNGTERTRDDLLAEAEQRVVDMWKAYKRRSLQRVINATGVIVHTNLGRAPLSENARFALLNAGGYSNVEYDLESGSRGSRGKYVEDLICELTSAEAAIVVNNCAAAAFLVLTAFAAGGEVVISRGEMVEIGGDFRVPDVLVRSGATLREVGTTNRTRLADFEKAINENTRMLLRVHPSNYRVVGFTAMPAIAPLADLAKRHGVILFEDIGSGAMLDLVPFGLDGEPLAQRSIRDGADIVSFSGDKLLGGPQSGIIAGRRDLLEQIRKHPLYRALRVDKLVYAALGATLEAYRRGTALEEIPVLRMIAEDEDSIRERTNALAEKLNAAARFSAEVVAGSSVIGGGSAPDFHPGTLLLSIKSKDRSADEIEARLRNAVPPVIARIGDDRVLIDLRTVSPDEENELLQAVIAAA